MRSAFGVVEVTTDGCHASDWLLLVLAELVEGVEVLGDVFLGVIVFFGVLGEGVVGECDDEVEVLGLEVG